MTADARTDQRVDQLEGRVGAIETRLGQGSDRMKAIEVGLAENTAATKQIAENTTELVAAFNALQGALKVLNMIGRLAKPLTAILGLAAAGVGLWAAMTKGIHIGGPKP